MPSSLARRFGSAGVRRGIRGSRTRPPPWNLTPPVLAGVVEIGATLSLTPGTWTGAPSLAYTLLRDGSPVPGVVDVDEAAFEAYELVAADVGPLLVARERDAVSGEFADSNAVQA